MKNLIKKLLFILKPLIVAAEAALLVGLCIHLKSHGFQIALLFSSFLIVFLFSVLFSKKTKMFNGIKGFLICLILPVLFAGLYCISDSAIKNNIYNFENTDNGKASVFENKNVMLIVPHEDDETLLLGGTIEEYIRYGSNVTVVFATNGDAVETSETKGTRLKEAISALSVLGVKEDRIIFLGYGDTWEGGKSHIYNSNPENVMTSTAGYTSTYGLPDHPAYNEGAQYTRNNLKSDIKNVILYYRPDVIYCIDYDKNCDHRSTSFLFEEAMGQILSEEKDYTPLVFKGFAYSTAMYSKFDYNQRNIASTVNPYSETYMTETNVYNWNERVRVPVSASSLSRLFRGTDIYKALECHKSQSVFRFAQGAANSDKVFWQRETSSVLYDAEFACEGKKISLLNDFKITDSANILDKDNSPINGDGVEIPKGEITVTLPQKRQINRIVIYDNPSIKDNVSNALITLDNGTEIKTGALKKNGSGTEILFDRCDVESFTFKIISADSNKAGITEIEAYNDKTDYGFDFIKMCDKNGNFIYDYLMDSNEETFSIFCEGKCSDIYSAKTDSETCTAHVKGNNVLVTCPAGESCTLTVSDGNGHSDTVRISHPKNFVELDIAILADNFYWKTLRFWNQKYYYVEFKKELMSFISAL